MDVVRRVAWISAPAVLVAAAIVALLAALAYGGGADPVQLTDTGPLARYGLPVVRNLTNLAFAATLGTLVLSCFALDPGKPEWGRALDLAAASAAVWTVASAGTALFTLLSIGQSFSLDPKFGDVLAQYLTTTEIGQGWLQSTLIAAVVTVLCFAVRNPTVLALVTLLAAYAWVPISALGHRGGTAQHDAASSAIFLHVVFAGVWLGGLLAIGVLRPVLGRDRLIEVLRRYSTIALISFLCVAASGYVSAAIRVETIPNLASPYGVLVLVKIGALLVLGLFGALHRRWTIRKLTASKNWFWWLVAAELAFMGIAAGVAAALARTATPVEEVSVTDLDAPTPAELLTGAPLPPEPTFERYLTLWNFDLIWILVCAFALFFYLAGVWRLRRRGDSWPWYRTALWVAGILLLFYVTNGGVNVYEKYLFSAHMIGHMALGMMVPLLLVPAAPITLALRAVHKRTDGSRGVREWLMLVVHSKVFGVFANPIVAGVLFAGSLWAFYFTPLFGWATTNHVGHQWMIVHFLATGYLFVFSLIGVDPSPVRTPYPIKLLILLGTMAFHAFFGLALITGNGLLLADWYGAMGWGTDALIDQRVAGGIAWSIGELPTVILAIIVATQWFRDDTRRAKRYDRKAERDNDAELAEYNAMLAERSKRP